MAAPLATAESDPQTISPAVDSLDQPASMHLDPKAKSRKRPSEDGAAPPRPAKRRAARACVSCRARKVRCNVIEGAPCGNCRWDKVECVVQENRRKKKTAVVTAPSGQGGALVEAYDQPQSQPLATRPSDTSDDELGSEQDVKRSLGCNDHGVDTSCISGRRDSQRPFYPSHPFGFQSLMDADGDPCSSSSNLFSSLSEMSSPRFTQLPPFVRPLPPKIVHEDVSYLMAKGALDLPSLGLQSVLLRAYIEFVHPYMPLLDLQPFLRAVNAYDGTEGQVSLFLHHAVMFSATAFVDMSHLHEAGYLTRKAARRAFFQKTRLLYDFDYESDRLVLIQGLLLMSYWYETPDDQKDTWHWMGVAVSLAQTIGLHRNMEATSLAPAARRLWKRIWWSCFMRDRLVALGMRRPTRIKDEDFDVPMLSEADFEVEALPEHITVVDGGCRLARDVEMQRELAAMCVQKAKLCVCISDMLKTQYSVLIRDNMEPENTASSSMMLFPNKEPHSLEGVERVDASLRAWEAALPACCRYRAPLAGEAGTGAGRATLAVQRTLLHMTYQTTVSALHRPQFLPSSPRQAPAVLSREVQERSRQRVKEAAMRITGMAAELHRQRLERYLPTTGVTCILPAMIIHLLEMKSPAGEARERATKGFRQCMRVMGKLREVYASADYATGFLDAALRKAAININANIEPATLAMMKQVPPEFHAQTPPPEHTTCAYSSTGTGTSMSPATMTMPQPQGALPPLLQQQGGGAGVYDNEYSEYSEYVTGGGSTDGGASVLPLQEPRAAVMDTWSAARRIDKRVDESPPAPAPAPAQTDDARCMYAAGLTPQTANGSEGLGAEREMLDMGGLEDWNAVSGTDLDIDRWLQFPAEGLGETM